jgi:hypothetical protein
MKNGGHATPVTEIVIAQRLTFFASSARSTTPEGSTRRSDI